MRRRKREASEINLTPLLDVLFSILFIVMMSGMQNEQGMKEDFEEQIVQMEQTITEYEEEISKIREQLSSYEDREASHMMYQTEAIILTVTNGVEEGNHYLDIRQGMNSEEFHRIMLGVNKTQNSQKRIEYLMNQIVEQTDNQPIYIVFHCNKDTIYTTEYRAVTEAFVALEEKEKEVFFKLMEDE